MRSLAAALLAAFLLATGCSSGGDDAPENGAAHFLECGLPSPEPDARVDLVPEELIPDGGIVAISNPERGGFLASISVPLTVDQAFGLYKRVMRDLGWEQIAVDNEGFEAEIYFVRKKDVAAVQIRMSTCEDASNVFVNVIAADRRGEPVPLPIPSGARSPSPAS